MAYIVPRVQIEQEFTQIATVDNQPLTAVIVGPQYDLYRYDNVDEKSSTAVTNPSDPELANAYQADTDVTYDFPNQIVGTTVDAASVQVHIESAEAEYYPNDIASTGGAVTRVAHPTIGGAYYPNRFKGTNLVFKTANGTDRSADFSNRDVKAGDIVILNDGSTDTKVKIKSLIPSRTTASLSAITGEAGNKAAATEDFNNAVVWAGTGGAPATPPANSSTNYDGHIDKGIVADTYTITVTAVGSTLDDVRFSIASANGAFATKTNQTVNGSDILIIDNTGTNAIQLDFTSATDPEVGDIWTLSVVAGVVPLVNASTIVSSGTYTGVNDLTYLVTVVRGGPFYTGSNPDVCARVAITSTALDSSPTVNVTSATPFAVGTKGVSITISGPTAGGGLILGDVYKLPVVAATDSAVNIVETYEQLPATLISGAGSYSIESLRYVSTVEIPSAIDAGAELYNWEVDSENQTITINSGIVTTNSEIVDGSPIDLPIKEGKVFVSHRDLVVTNSISVGSVTGTAQVEDALGKIDPENPIAQGVYLAALNAGNVPVYYVTIGTDSIDGYSDALELLKGSTSYYGVVPLTHDTTVIGEYVSHVNAMSTADEAKWRVLWASLALTKTRVLYGQKEDETDYTATVTDDPFAAGTQYKLVTVAGATFVTDGVRPTDSVRINYRTNEAGAVVYDSYTVAEVRTETTLVLTTALTNSVTSPVKVEIVRNYTKDEQATAYAQTAGGFNNRRVRAVFPDVVKNGTTSLEGYHVAAALAGLRSTVVPHQGLTNTVVLGFTDVRGHGFTETQLNRMAEEGVFIVTQAVVGATPYVRHQLTTATDSLNTSEDSITTNVDSISLGMQAALSPYIGIYNIHTDAIAVIRAAVEAELNFRATGTYTVRAGNQIITYTITKFYQHPDLKDRLVVEVRLEIPYPLNYINLTFIV